MPNPKNIEKYKWKPGQKVKGAGRPKGVLNTSTVLKKLGDEKFEWKDPVSGKMVKRALRDHAAWALVKGVLDRDIKFIREYLDRTEGKAAQQIQVTNSEDSVQTIRIIGGLPD